MIPNSFKDDLLSKADIVDIVGRHVELKKGGATYKGLCPFHAERRPSFTVTPARQTYHCFGCGAHGDAIKFLMEHLGLNFVEAVKDLAQIVGMTVPDDEGAHKRAGSQEANRPTITLREALAKAEAHFMPTLRNSAEAVDFLKGHGIAGTTAGKFRVGFAPNAVNGLASVFSHYADQGLLDAGLVLAGDGRRSDAFVNHVVFPVRNINGDLIGMVGMPINGPEGGGLAKHVAPGSKAFDTRVDLYGIAEARAQIRTSGYAVVVDNASCLDILALHQCGVHNAVGCIDQHVSLEQINRVLRLTDKVMFLCDGSRADEIAALASQVRATAEFKVASMDSGTSPLLFIQTKGLPAMRARLASATAMRAHESASAAS